MPTGRDLIYPSLDAEGVYYVLEGTPVVTGDELVDAVVSSIRFVAEDYAHESLLFTSY